MRAARRLLGGAAAATLALELALALSCVRAAPLGGVARSAERGRWWPGAPRERQQPGVELKRPSPFAAAAPPAPGVAPPAEPGPTFEEGGLFEGDIILSPDEVEWLKHKKATGSGAREGRNLVASRRQLWPGGIVYYDWGSEFSNITHRRYIISALKDIEKNSCVRFRKRTTQKTYLLLRNTRSGCAAPVGYVPIGRPIDLYLGQPGCQRRGTVQHEFLHTLGFWHEHTRPDRDQYVSVQWSNIKPGLEFNFFVRPAKDVQYLRMPYDYGSVLHYRSVAFSKDGQSHTLEPKDPRALGRMGQRMRFSKIDLAKLNRLYNCPPPYYRGNDVEIKKKKLAGSSEPISERLSEKEEETSEEWLGPYPLNSTWEHLVSVLPAPPPPLPEISTAPPSTELPEPPKLPTPSPEPAPPMPLTRPPALPEPSILPAPPALPEPTEPPDQTPPLPEPPKLPTVTVEPPPLPEPSQPETSKSTGVLESLQLPVPTIIPLPPSPLPEPPVATPLSPPPLSLPHLPSIPPPPPLLPLPTLPPHFVPIVISILSSTPPPSFSLLPSSGSGSESAPAPEGPVYVIEEKTVEGARALERANGHGEPPVPEHFPSSPPALSAPEKKEERESKGETLLDVHDNTASTNGTAPEEASALVELFQYLAGVSSWKISE